MKRFVVPLLGLTALVSFLLGLVAQGSRAGSAVPSAPLSTTERPTGVARGEAADAPATAVSATGANFSAVVARLRPAVVNVHAASRTAGDHGPAQWRYPREAEVGTSQTGGGFIIQASGAILTNFHLVENADRVTVTLSDDRVFRADIVGVDPAIDVALLHIDAGGPLPVVPLGRSDALRVGDWVCAIGNPVGYMGSVTVGVVSFLDREIPELSVDGVIQSDVPMSLGSSGGPLVNSRGQVVGITTAISTQSANIGFAIPMDQISAVLPQLREFGRVSRGFLSIGLTTLTPELRRALRVDPAHGVVVEEVTPDRSAERAGVRTYDVVQAIDDTAVTSEQELVHAISERAPGALARLSIWRDGVTLSVPVKLEERPLPATIVASALPGVRHAAAPDQGPLGLRVRDLDAATAKPLPDAMTGVVVSDVDPAGAAQMAGIRRGQIVLEVDRHRVSSAAEFGAALALLHAGDSSAILVYEPALREYRIVSVAIDPRP